MRVTIRVEQSKFREEMQKVICLVQKKLMKGTIVLLVLTKTEFQDSLTFRKEPLTPE
jgi:hypothetical protein